MLFRCFARAFDKHGDGLAQERLVVLLTDFVLQREQVVIAAALYVLRHIVTVKLGALRPGAFAVFEDEAVFEP